MKKINSLFSAIFFVFFSCDGFNFRDSFIYRHKKKAIGCTIVVILLGKIYFTNKEFNDLYNKFEYSLKNPQKNSLEGAYKFYLPKFKDITSSYFLIPKNSKKLHELIENHSVPWNITFNATKSRIIDLDQTIN